MSSFAETTQGVTITVQPAYLDAQSSPMQRKFAFAYFIEIRNGGDEPVQLLRRHWHIADSEGKVTEVEGEGVIGKQPVIQPGEAHRYNSFCVIETFEGSMEGTYLMQWNSGELFHAVIPRFALRAAAN
jgi:ApaG protein